MNPGESPAPESGPYWSLVERLEGVVIREALSRSGGNQIQAARLIGINRNTLRRKILDLGIAPQDPREGST